MKTNTLTRQRRIIKDDSGGFVVEERVITFDGLVVTYKEWLEIASNLTREEALKMVSYDQLDS